MARAGRAGRAGRDPLAGARRVIVDGRNVQFALRRSTAADLPEAALVARLRAALPIPDVRLVLDGHPAGGPQGRVAPGFVVAYSRNRDADSVIADLVADGARELGPAGSDAILVVTDDRAVRDHARRHGARVEGAAWLTGRMGRAATGGPVPGRPGTGIGHARPPRSRDASRGGSGR